MQCECKYSSKICREYSYILVGICLAQLEYSHDVSLQMRSGYFPSTVCIPTTHWALVSGVLRYT